MHTVLVLLSFVIGRYHPYAQGYFIGTEANLRFGLLHFAKCFTFSQLRYEGVRHCWIFYSLIWNRDNTSSDRWVTCRILEWAICQHLYSLPSKHLGPNYCLCLTRYQPLRQLVIYVMSSFVDYYLAKTWARTKSGISLVCSKASNFTFSSAFCSSDCFCHGKESSAVNVYCADTMLQRILGFFSMLISMCIRMVTMTGTTDLIYGCSIFKWVAETWLDCRVPV